MLVARITSRYPSKKTLEDCFQLLLSETHFEQACFGGEKKVSFGVWEMNSNFFLCYHFNYIQIEKTY